ncbi:MAG: ATP-binding protein [Bacteroidetes bacterium]|nr:MAG: ATP-binding protein [Bacteroidota bacterium]
MIKRVIEKQIVTKFFKGKAIILLGPRQSGKSTLIESILNKRKEKILWLNGDDSDTRTLLSETNSTKLKNITSGYKIVFIDEAQRITNIGLTIKIIVDKLKDVQLIATGSSAFELTAKINEPLTGRKYVFMLYPLSFQEMCDEHGLLEEKRQIEYRMVFGSFPEIVTKPEESEDLLKTMAESYLYKDLLSLEQINKPILLEKIVKALALQVGSEVKFHEVGQIVSADPLTVEKYIDLLEKAYVLFRLPALNRNIRNEIKKGKKIYFFDNGIRNAVIGNFRNLSSREDKGALWENYLMSERMKYLMYNKKDVFKYFWRTALQQEIDYIEETGGTFDIFKFKWSPSARAKFSKSFTGNYLVKEKRLVNFDNVEEFLLQS